MPDNRYDQIIVQNIDTDDFEFAVDKNVYTVRAGEARAFPRFIANYFVKHLVDHMINKLDNPKITTANTKYRQQFASQIVLEERPIAAPRVKTQAEMDREVVEKMTTSTDLDAVLAKLKRKEVDTEETLIEPPETVMPQPDLSTIKTKNVVAKTKSGKSSVVSTEEFAGLKVEPTDSNEDGAAKLPPQIEDGEEVKLPERSKVMAYARDSLKLNVDDPKSKKVWDKMSVEQLVKEFDYPVNEEE